MHFRAGKGARAGLGTNSREGIGTIAHFPSAEQPGRANHTQVSTRTSGLARRPEPVARALLEVQRLVAGGKVRHHGVGGQAEVGPKIELVSDAGFRRGGVVGHSGGLEEVSSRSTGDGQWCPTDDLRQLQPLVGVGTEDVVVVLSVSEPTFTPLLMYLTLELVAKPWAEANGTS